MTKKETLNRLVAQQEGNLTSDLTRILQGIKVII